MKRYITYLYLYEQNKKTKNVGFIRLDVFEEEIRMEIHIRHLGRFTGKVNALILVDDGVLKGIKACDLEIINGGADIRIESSRTKLFNSKFALDAAIGVRIEPIENCFIASCWKDKSSDRIVQAYEPEIAFDNEKNKEKEAEDKPHQQIEYEKELETKPHRQREYEHQYIEETQEEKQVEKNPTEENQTAKETVQKIDLTDIKKLPQRNWYLSRNSFLLHGFLNYHYLVIRNTEENGKKVRYLGVPGIYEEPERMMAMLFGFTDYIEGDEPPVGYWLCKIDE